MPIRYTCDGKRDCPLGDDEANCVNRTCDGLFRCQNSGKCLHYYDFEDGKIDCPDGDDESLISLSSCPMGCDCFSDGLMHYIFMSSNARKKKISLYS